GSDRIRGHGIPEALEAILIGGSRVEPRVAILKPISSAISIGSGGPFGAEGPIILTGGAVGSLIAQFFSMTDAERKTLLVAGASAGMAATFGTPVAAVLLAVELLLFEFKPRSLVPVAVACAAAAIARRYLLGMPPLFPTPPHPLALSPQTLAACVVAGLVAGALSSLMTMAVYAAEDFFFRLPIHWMWWPALGGIAIGVGGLIYPPALGVGYDVIGTMLAGKAPIEMFIGVLFVKTAIWSIALGSGTSGGVLAPLLMIGGAMGGLEALGFPANGPGFWPLIGMAAILGGTMRAPLTGVVFTLELTHDVNLLLPLLVATTVAYAFTVLAMKRSILTEKVSRRGFHLTREYSVDPLELTLTRQAMRTDVVALPASLPLTDLPALREQGGMRQGLYPVIDDQGDLVGVVSRSDLQQLTTEPHPPGATLAEWARRDPIVAYPDELVRNVVARMATTGRTRFPVVSPDDQHRLVGMIGLVDVLGVRELAERAEHDRERVLRLRFHRPRRNRVPANAAASQDRPAPLE
ncbi:MAG TPA: chloride channel protein, partial [Thermomicrobiales bacterium]|nr:chloride channel protein [Thermomicrobiales bacterium]